MHMVISLRPCVYDRNKNGMFLNTNIQIFSVNLYTRTKYVEDKVDYAFITVIHNFLSYQIVRKYFDTSNLKNIQPIKIDVTSKIFTKKINLSKENWDKIKTIKNQFNSKRKIFDFSHIHSLTF